MLSRVAIGALFIPSVIAAQAAAPPTPPKADQAIAPPPGYVLDKPDPWAAFNPQRPEKLGPGPHTLVISDGNAMTRIEYKSGPTCQRARDKVRLQTDARLTNTNPYVIYATPRVTAFCVPH